MYVADLEKTVAELREVVTRGRLDAVRPESRDESDQVVPELQ